MNNQADWLPLSDYALHAAAFAVIMASWFAFALVFFLRRQPPQATESTRDSRSKVGIALQGLSYAFVWALMRRQFTHIAPLGRILDLLVAVLTIALAIGSVWFVTAAVRALGKQWSLTARVVEGHDLITTGPYTWVRHPIYTGMFGMLLATGLAASHWLGLLMGVIVFWAGTIIRVRSEERLLRATFGAQYDDYARRVAAVLPGIY